MIKRNVFRKEKEVNRFINLLKQTEKINIDLLINYLENETDFFVAPASSNYHGNYYGGLLEHSLLVYDNMVKINNMLINPFNKNELIISGLLHDICKSNFYTDSIRNKKIDNKWVQEPYFAVDDMNPLGHGEKSVIIIQQFIKLNENELYAIRWHMMSYDDVTRGYTGNLSLTNALTKYPIITLIHMADLFSISLLLKEVKND